MSIDLNALANVHAQVNDSRQKNQEKALKVLKDWHDKEEQKELAVVAQSSNDVGEVVKELNYTSDAEDFVFAEMKNNEWLTAANTVAKTENDKKINQAVWESKNLLIKEQSRDAETYAGLQDNIDSKWDKIQELKTDDGKFDFSEIQEILDDYKKVGENILSYNNNWVHRQNYLNNINKIEKWIDLGQEFQTLDVDSTKEGIQTDDPYPSYNAILNRSYQSWKLGNTANAQNAMNKSLDYLTGSIKAQEEAKLLSDEMIQENAIAYMENISETKMSDIIHYSDLLKEYEINLANGVPNITRPEPPVNFSPEEIIIAQGFKNQNPAYSDQLNLNKQRYNQDMESAAFGAINSVQNALGKGIGDGLSVDSDLTNDLIEIGTYSTAKGKLTSAGNRKAAVKDIGKNIESIFAYLESGLQGRLPGDDFYDSTGEVRKLLDGEYAEGSPDYYIALDKILNDYMPINELNGIRQVNQKAKSETVDEFGGDNQKEEENGFEILKRYLEAYDAIRVLDRRFGEDPANILNIRPE